ncbi:hypothetical protein DVA67_016185 [Solirubrobacter sp. CPCC 204708]|uniref:DUF2238 domain-containing protein n=1 Tax=Solirubrobacter deserti TaxID=2282478 RepID=A0ABT4RPS7_9ACTN|nr:hypothetical protein [Solirubrobacter deserti]MBE2317523.1 hypothetical protein [Solirubrobacter deserti]MDA0140301.1 hypothetical protein [Solirubrobacter deserti]
MLRALNLAAKVALIGLLLFAIVRPDLPQFAGKAMTTRLFTFGISAVLLPLIWLVLRPRRPYPHAIDLCLLAPFLLDTAGNALDLYGAVEWFDDAMHYLNWIPWTTAFGLALAEFAPPVPRWALFGLVLGFGAVTHILWELAEFFTFIRGGPEEATAYRDTLGDLTLSLCGSVTGALIVTLAASRTRTGRRTSP